MSKIFLNIFLTLLIGFSSVQRVSAENFWRWLKDWADSSDIKGCDTTYVRMPDEGFVAYLMSSPSWASTSLKAHDTAGDAEMTLSSRVINMWALRLAYRGWGLSYSRAFKNRDDSEFAFTSYGRRYGFEFRVHSSHDLNGRFSDYSQQPAISGEFEGISSLKSCLLNFYWVFNSKRFSLPAAMSHTTIQRRSAGSWLACTNYVYTKFSFHPDFEMNADDTKGISFKQVNIGGGYAYNYAFGHEHCLLHASVMPMISIWHQNRAHVNDGTVYPIDQQDISLSGMAHLGFVYNFDRYVTGMSCIYNLSHIYSPQEDVSIYVNDFSATAYFGVRF